MSKGMLAALLFSVIIAVSLSLLPSHALEGWGNNTAGVKSRRDVPVMKMDGVVDELGTLSLRSHLQKVIWEREKLIVWLAVPSAKLKKERPLDDVYMIAHRFLVGVPYYREVEVKIVASERPQTVQLSVLVDRALMLDAPKPGTAEARKFAEQKLKIDE